MPNITTNHTITYTNYTPLSSITIIYLNFKKNDYLRKMIIFVIPKVSETDPK